MNLPGVAKLHALTKVSKIQILYTWEIEHFSFCSKKQDCLESSTFSSEKKTGDSLLKWKIRLYTKGINEKYKQYMGLFLVLAQDKSLNKKIPKEVNYNFCILNSSNQKVNLVRSHEIREFKENDQWGFPKFLPRSLIDLNYDSLVPNDQLTILVEMCVYGHISTLDKIDDQSLSKLKINLKELNNVQSIIKPSIQKMNKCFKEFLLNDKYSDLILITLDGKEMPAHRILLANESKIFQHKFDNLKSNRLELKNFDSQTLEDILSYIYTRNMNFKSNLDKLILFADIYQLNELKIWLENEMINKITISNAPKYYLIANQCNTINLKDKVSEFIRINLNNLDKTEEWLKLQETHPNLVTEIYKKILIDK